MSPVQSPVLVILWKRAETARKTLKRVADAQPRRVYVAADGPRAHIPGEIAACERTREVVDEFDWPAGIFKRFVAANHGAALAIHDAMAWFFENEEEGIVIEDDSLPQHEFFPYCDELLDRFRHNHRVFQISGVDHSKGLAGSRSSYYFSHHQHIWGFATWRRSWAGFSKLFYSPSEQEIVDSIDKLEVESSRMRRIWKKRVFAEISGADDNWDSRWNLHAKSKKQLCVVPSQSLVQNVGYDTEGLHTRRYPLIAGRPPIPSEFSFPLTHPDKLESDPRVDLYVSRVQWSNQPVVIKFLLSGLELVRRILASISGGKTDKAGQIMNDQAYLTIAERFWRARSGIPKASLGGTTL